MKRFKARQIYLLFILILSGFLITGCGSGGGEVTEHWAPAPYQDTTKPMVTVTYPATTDPGPTAGPAANAAITATFSEAMAPATINSPAVSFTVMNTTHTTPVAGTVTYIVASKIARFKPTADLTPGDTYTATIKGIGASPATDLAGNALAGNTAALPAASDYVWTFIPTDADSTAPTVTLTVPADGATGVAINSAVNATFSKAMDPATMIPANVTVKETVLGTVVDGRVAYDVQNKIATFSPLANLKPFTNYTAKIATEATDVAGNALAGGAVPNPWTFTTAAESVLPLDLAINLRSAKSFGIASRAGLTSTGVTVVNGDVALYPTPTCTDSTGNLGASETCLEKIHTSPTGMTVNGSIYWAGDPFDSGGTALTVTNDLNTAWIEGKNKVDTYGPGTIAGEQLAGKTLIPGVYHEANLGLSASGIATFDAKGDANAIFIIKVDSTFVDSGTLLLPSQIILRNGAQARNVWFVAGLDITIGSGTTWNGNILAGRTATVNDGSSVMGRVLAGAAGSGAVTLTGAASPSVTTITVPAD